MSMEIEETLRRISSHRGVKGVIICNSEGAPIRSNLPEDEEPRLTLYRDTAAWCPYCEKVWLLLEEKRVPYQVEKVNMNCYGDKPEWFWRMQPSGGIPVARLDDVVIRESNDIMMAVEQAFPQRPMLPDARAEPERFNTLPSNCCLPRNPEKVPPHTVCGIFDLANSPAGLPTTMNSSMGFLLP